jgi:hypothetical protein
MAVRVAAEDLEKENATDSTDFTNLKSLKSVESVAFGGSHSLRSQNNGTLECRPVRKVQIKI